MSAATRGGLGRGLAAILPTAESSEREQLSGSERVLRSLVDAGLAQLGSSATLDLVAYLHLPRFDEPVLFLHRPALSTMSASRAYRLFARFAQASQAASNEGSFTQDGTVTIFLRTAGTASDGIHFLGANGVLDATSLAPTRATAHTFATIANQYVAGTPADLHPPRLVVELSDHGTTVRAAGGDGAHIARATAADPQEAVVRAVLDATESPCVFRSAREVMVDGRRAVLVMLADVNDSPRPGFVLTDDDLLQSTALATMRALSRR